MKTHASPGRRAIALVAALLALLATCEALAQGVRPTGRGGAMAVKPVVCRTVDAASGKSGQELADAVEVVAARFAQDHYALAALLPGDPPIACFQSRTDTSKLPMGAR
jgi:hypothetical protein